MDFYPDTSNLSIDAHLMPSTFANAEYMHPDASSMDFMFASHGMWNPEATYNQGLYYGDMCAYGPSMVYDAPMACNLNVEPNYQIYPPQIVEQKAVSCARQKRKCQSTTIPTAQKQQKQTNSQRSSVSSSSSSSSTASDSASPAAPSARAHYAVEKRYRTTLNDRYATLARLVSQSQTQEICRTENKDWEVPSKLDSSSSSSASEKRPCKRQSKTTTLSVAIDTIALLDRCCMRKAKELEKLRYQLNRMVSSMSPGADICDEN